MVAPTFASISALFTGTTTADATPAVPSGVASGSLVIIAVAANSATNGGTVTDFATVVAATQANASARSLWKRATGADAGTYSVPHTATAGNASTALAFRVEGEQASGTPIGQTNSASATGVTTVPTTSLTGTAVDSLLVHVVWSFNARTYTPPSGFARQTASASQRLHISTMTSPGGNTGNINGSMGTAGMTGALLFEILPESAQNLAVTGFDVAVEFGTPVLRSSVPVTGFDVAVEFGTPTLVPDQLVTPAGFDLTMEFGAPSLAQGVQPSGFDLTVEFGTPVLQQSLPVDGFDLVVSFGTPGISHVVQPDGLDLLVEFGTPTIIVGSVLNVTGFDVTVDFGSPTVSTELTISGTVFNHETGSVVSGATVRLFDDNDVKVDQVTSGPDGSFLFLLGFNPTDTYYTTATWDDGGTQYTGASDRGCEPS